mmetsp:Transcript_141244/g.393651  ORF Transcript_141244/g.393651 Transcript_141244/m.393651 type:complete len:358 (-) Transcript_141244:778-1851(-)
MPVLHVRDEAQGHEVGHPQLLAHRAPQLVGQVLLHQALEVPLHLLGRTRLMQAVHHGDLRLDAHLVLPEEAYRSVLYEGQLGVLLEHGQRLDQAPAADQQRHEDALRGDDHLQGPHSCVFRFLITDNLPNRNGVVRPPEALVVLVEGLRYVLIVDHLGLQQCPNAAVQVRDERQRCQQLPEPDDILHGLKHVYEGVCMAHRLHQANGPQHLQEAQRLQHLCHLCEASQACHGEHVSLEVGPEYRSDQNVEGYCGQDVDPEPEAEILLDAGSPLHDQLVSVDVACGEVQADVHHEEGRDRPVEHPEPSRHVALMHEDQLKRCDPKVNQQAREGHEVPAEPQAAHGRDHAALRRRVVTE